MTPMMEQWSQLKAQAGEAFLFFRLGDFYELFGDDAVKAAPIMGVTLTSRNSKSEDATALCGVPFHNFEIYLHKILDRGFSVALAEQVEEPAAGKKLVRREIVQFFTPGIRLLENQERPSYAAFVVGNESQWYLAAGDVSTGHLVLENGKNLESLQDLVERLPIKDLRSDFGSAWALQCSFQKSCNLLSEREAKAKVLHALQLVEENDSPCRHLKEWLALGSLLKVLEEAHPQQKLFFNSPQRDQHGVAMSAATRRHLHLFEPSEHSLFQYLDETRTAVGRRCLKNLISHPTQDLEEIHRRQSLIRFWKKNSWERQEFRRQLSGVHDIDRLLRLRKTATRIFQLKESLISILKSKDILKSSENLFLRFAAAGDKLQNLKDLLESRLQWSETENKGWIKNGVNTEIDELRELQQNAELLLAQLENSLREKTQVNSLKIRFHQVFGYIAEVTRQHQEKIPSSAKIVQSLANAVRFKNTELEELETKLLSLESRLEQAEEAELQKIYLEVENSQTLLSELAFELGQLDAFQSLAEISSREAWVTPRLASSDMVVLRVREAKHPLSVESFVPLSFELESHETRTKLLTGPNMAGKSTVLRIAALMALLHQIGSDVPAQELEISVFDRIMCRMGAVDDLTQGKSTFFVEMKEVSSMLYGATERSLLLFDEIGRGTSTYDGMSLAWAITEDVHQLGCLSIVATHYLELAALEKSLSYLKNYHLGVKEINSQLIFTRKLERGPASQSYGIQVARLAALPDHILARAQEKLREFETKDFKRKKPAPLFEWAKQNVQSI